MSFPPCHRARCVRPPRPLNEKEQRFGRHPVGSAMRRRESGAPPCTCRLGCTAQSNKQTNPNRPLTFAGDARGGGGCAQREPSLRAAAAAGWNAAAAAPARGEPTPGGDVVRGCVQSRCRCGRGEPIHSANVAGGAPSPGADVAGLSPVPVQMWHGACLLAKSSKGCAPRMARSGRHCQLRPSGKEPRWERAKVGKREPKWERAEVGPRPKLGNSPKRDGTKADTALAHGATSLGAAACMGSASQMLCCAARAVPHPRHR